MFFCYVENEYSNLTTVIYIICIDFGLDNNYSYIVIILNWIIHENIN